MDSCTILDMKLEPNVDAILDSQKTPKKKKNQVIYKANAIVKA